MSKLVLGNTRCNFTFFQEFLLGCGESHLHEFAPYCHYPPAISLRKL